MSKTINLGINPSFRDEFTKLQTTEADFRAKLIENINALVYDIIAKHAGNQNNFITLEDGPSLIGSEEDSQVDRVVMGVFKDKVLISEEGNDYQPMALTDLITETLIDVHGALEIEIENGTDELDVINQITFEIKYYLSKEELDNKKWLRSVDGYNTKDEALKAAIEEIKADKENVYNVVKIQSSDMEIIEIFDRVGNALFNNSWKGVLKIKK